MPTPTGEPAYDRFQRLFSRYRFHFEHQEGLCFYCRQPMALPDPMHAHGAPLPPDRVTKEHLITRAEARRKLDGPRSLHRPTVAACHACNQQRGGSMRWQTFLAQKIAQQWRPK